MGRLLPLLPRLVLLAAVAYSLVLQALVPADLFVTGDAGLKFLLTRQLAGGRLEVPLTLPAPQWARALWDQGLYPFRWPTVQEVDGHRFIHYPFVFPLLSVPGYLLFGSRGLLLLPLFSCWLLWLVFLAACRRLEIGPGASAVALAGLAFASPVTFYCATFWEHVPAVTLGFAGTALLLSGGPLRPRRAALAGLLLGSSIWLREELAALAAACLLVLVLPAARRAPRAVAAFLASAAAAGALLLAVNLGVYGHPLGVHSFELLGKKLLLAEQLGRGRGLLRELGLDLFRFFPLALLPLAHLAVSAAVRDLPRPPAIVRLVAVAALATGGVAAMAPTAGGLQWGPRFLLAVVPIAALAAALALTAFSRSGLRWLGAAVFVVYFGIGAALNVWGGGQELARLSAGFAPALAYLRSVPEKVVAISQPFQAEELAVEIGPKTFFLTRSKADFQRLAPALLEQDTDRFVFLCNPVQRICRPPTGKPRYMPIEYPDRVLVVEFDGFRRVGRLYAFHGVVRAPTKSPGMTPGSAGLR